MTVGAWLLLGLSGGSLTFSINTLIVVRRNARRMRHLERRTWGSIAYTQFIADRMRRRAGQPTA